MSQNENQGTEPASAQPPAADAGVNEVRTPAPRINEAKLESAHAELPPLSVIGATAEPAAKPGTIAQPKQFGRRGTPRGAPAANGSSPRPSIGVVENPAEITENLSGGLAQSSAPRREERPRREEAVAEGEVRQPGIPSDERPRREDRPRREPRPEGASHGDRPRREPRQDGDRPRREERPRREDRPRIQIEPVVIPVQAPIGFWATVKRKLATLFGIPNKAVFVPSQRPHQPRGEHRGERSDRGSRGGSRGGRGRGDFRGGSRGGRGPRNGPREG